ncbi:hypothetical protein MFIFM68171_09608 [Madurella fahalii]|uniref:Methyltransferase type 11 domain-containing protein n=1 Tax=Madurella fahalii TaxID=1157608 RepID=A0ABQ0GNT7_9PEZI
MALSRSAAAAELQKVYANAGKGVTASEFEETVLDNGRRVSTPLVMRLLSQMGLGNDTDKPFRLFENACGAGVVAPALQKLIKPDVLKQSSILCGDFSEPLVTLAKSRMENEGWLNTEVRRIDAQKTGLASGSFSHVATNIAFHVMPDSEAAVDEAIRVLAPGGVFGCTTWHKEASWVTHLKKAFASFPFEASFDFGLQTTEWGEWSDINWIRKMLVSKGLEDVKVEVFAFISHVDNLDYFLERFSMPIDSVLKSQWTEEQKKAHPREEVMRLVREFLEKKFGPDEGWESSWVSIIATGRVPC